MPRSASNSTSSTAAANVTNRNGQLKLRWSFSYEYDWPANPSAANARGTALPARAYADDLTAVLDKALAYAG